jgi:hypothetical protein
MFNNFDPTQRQRFRRLKDVYRRLSPQDILRHQLGGGYGAVENAGVLFARFAICLELGLTSFKHNQFPRADIYPFDTMIVFGLLLSGITAS